MLRRGSSAGRERGWYHRDETAPAIARRPRPVFMPPWTRPTADSLLAIAEDARARVRREDPESAALIEARYPELLEALDWYLDAGQPDQAFRLATALVPFWMSTKRIDDGDRWLAGALGQSAGSAPRRARATYDHGYLVFWAGRYELGGGAVRRRPSACREVRRFEPRRARPGRCGAGRPRPGPRGSGAFVSRGARGHRNHARFGRSVERASRPRRRAPDGGRPRRRSRRHDTPPRTRTRERRRLHRLGRVVEPEHGRAAARQPRSRRDPVP